MKTAEDVIRDFIKAIPPQFQNAGYWNLDSAIEHAKEFLESKEESARRELEKALRNLVSLKRWKDEHGKDHHYEQFQPKAWSYAIGILNDIDESKSEITP